MKKTKIIATIGPASESLKTLTAMGKAGLSIARLNFSHGTYTNHAMLIRHVRAVAKKIKVPIAILQDLQGPKIRIAELKHPFAAKTGRTVILGRDFDLDVDATNSIKPQDRILIQDGLIELKVLRVARSGQKSKADIFCQVITGGKIQSHKGVNLPDTQLDLRGLTAKDIRDLEWGFSKKFDYVAMSFVRTAADITSLRKRIAKNIKRGKLPKIVAKIEKPEAVKNIASIIKAADVIMVARGDLGVEMPAEQVPTIQNAIIKKCLKAHKPVIVATQMLESMVLNPRPTRAETSDVADAVLDGADYVMLSEETATGEHPVEAVQEMQRIIKATIKS